MSKKSAKNRRLGSQVCLETLKNKNMQKCKNKNQEFFKGIKWKTFKNKEQIEQKRVKIHREFIFLEFLKKVKKLTKKELSRGPEEINWKNQKSVLTKPKFYSPNKDFGILEFL